MFGGVVLVGMFVVEVFNLDMNEFVFIVLLVLVIFVVFGMKLEVIGLGGSFEVEVIVVVVNVMQQGGIVIICVKLILEKLLLVGFFVLVVIIVDGVVEGMSVLVDVV